VNASAEDRRRLSWLLSLSEKEALLLKKTSARIRAQKPDLAWIVSFDETKTAAR